MSDVRTYSEGQVVALLKDLRDTCCRWLVMREERHGLAFMPLWSILNDRSMNLHGLDLTDPNASLNAPYETSTYPLIGSVVELDNGDHIEVWPNESERSDCFTGTLVKGPDQPGGNASSLWLRSSIRSIVRHRAITDFGRLREATSIVQDIVDTPQQDER